MYGADVWFNWYLDHSEEVVESVQLLNEHRGERVNLALLIFLHKGSCHSKNGEICVHI